MNLSYDSARNRLTRSTDTGASGTRNLGYDARGNVTALGGLNLIYDFANQPVSVSGAASALYTYDGNLKRVKTVENGETVYQFYSASGALLYRDNATTGEKTDYIQMGGMTVARLDQSGVASYTFADHLGSPTVATNASGAILWREIHTPYGETWQRAAANDNHPAFTGHVRDENTGLTYMQARFYDPVIGRFLSSDPVGFREGGPGYVNRYWYTMGDPVNYTDPSGTHGMCEFCANELEQAGLTGEQVDTFQADMAEGGLEAMVDATPVVGDIKGVVEFANDPSWLGAAAVVIGVVPGGDLAKPLLKNGDEAVDVFRVVDDTELADIMDTGAFRTAPGSFEGKQFVDNLGDAKALQQRFSEFFGGNQTIVQGTAPRSVIDNAGRTPFSDIPNGQAITVSPIQLPAVRPVCTVNCP